MAAMKVGTVFLVGAGPGDPGLITLRGIQCLRQADVVLYDYLVNPRILEHAARNAELICLGKHGQSRIWTQAEINERMTALALNGKIVVRLKGGDPGVFGRQVEEVSALVAAGVSYSIVPGVTAALAAASYAGISLTHRESASAVALVTAQEHAEKQTASLDYHALAEFPGTLVFYMGMTTAKHWSSQLIGAGKPADTPVAIVRRCTFADQQIIRCTLAEVDARIHGPPKIRPPAICIVGKVAEPSEVLPWFEQRPLFGRRILVTRPRHQSAEIAEMLELLGAEVLNHPAIEIQPPSDWRSVDQLFAHLREFDWIVFSSANGVTHFFDRLEQSGRDLRALGSAKLATIGPGTADQLARYHLRADLQPAEFRAESLADALATNARGKRFLLIRASRGREILAERLREAHAIVEQVVVYQSTDVQHVDPSIAESMSNGKIDWVTVTSSAIARSMARLFGERLRRTKLASISPVTTATLIELGFSAAVEAEEYTMAGVAAAIVKAESAAARSS